MPDKEDLPSDPADDLAAVHPRRSKAPWIIALVLLAAAGGTMGLYALIEQRGLSLKGAGHLLVLPAEQGGAWAMYLDGTLLQVTAASVQRLGARTGPCEAINGSLQGDLLDLESLECTPGPLQKRLGDRLKWMGLKFAYWDRSVPFTGDTLEADLQTPEIVAAMVDPRPDSPQLVPLYSALFPPTLAAQRVAGRLPVPLLLHVKRDDLQIRRLTRTELSQFLARPRYRLAGAAVSGGWIVRTIDIDPTASVTLERLLLAPEEAPWPELLQQPTLRVSRRTPLPSAGALVVPAVRAAPDAGGR